MGIALQSVLKASSVSRKTKLKIYKTVKCVKNGYRKTNQGTQTKVARASTKNRKKFLHQFRKATESEEDTDEDGRKMWKKT